MTSKTFKDEALSISKLTKYLADRYKLMPITVQGERAEVKGVYDEHETYTDVTNFELYEKEIRRLMKKVMVRRGHVVSGVVVDDQEVSLWCLTQVENGRTHRITISDFNLFCFDAWAKYLAKNWDGHYDADQLEADRQAVQNLREEERIKTLALVTDDYRYYPSDREVREMAMNIMIKALFELHFTPIDEEKLRADMQHDYYLVDEENVSNEDVDIYHRLHHPEGIYYHRRDQ